MGANSSMTGKVLSFFLEIIINRVKSVLSLKPIIKFILFSFVSIFILGVGAELYAQSTNTRIPIPNLSFNVNEAKKSKRD